MKTTFDSAIIHVLLAVIISIVILLLVTYACTVCMCVECASDFSEYSCVSSGSLVNVC